MSRCEEKCDFSVCTVCTVGKCALLGGVEDDILLRMLTSRTRFTFGRGEIIPDWINNQSGFHLVRSGAVKISFRGSEVKAIKIAGPGTLLGLGSAELPGKCAEAMSDVSTCFFPANDFDEMKARSPRMVKNLIDYLCREDWQNSRRIAGLASHLVRRRVESVLNELALEFGVPSEHGIKINLILSRKVFGEMAGAVTETLARVLTELEKERLIVREKWAIHVTPKSSGLNKSIST